MERYFKLTEETIVNEAGRKLRQIECIRDFKFAHAGELGGFIEKEENLGGEAWVDEGGKSDQRLGAERQRTGVWPLQSEKRLGDLRRSPGV